MEGYWAMRSRRMYTCWGALKEKGLYHHSLNLESTILYPSILQISLMVPSLVRYGCRMWKGEGSVHTIQKEQILEEIWFCKVCKCWWLFRTILLVGSTVNRLLKTEAQHTQVERELAFDICNRPSLETPNNIS